VAVSTTDVVVDGGTPGWVIAVAVIGALIAVAIIVVVIVLLLKR